MGSYEILLSHLYIDLIVLGDYCCMKIAHLQLFHSCENQITVGQVQVAVFLILRADVLCSVFVIVILFGRLFSDFKLRINISCC